MKTDASGPAFPQVGEQFNHDIGERETVTTSPGMSLREYFAAKAMQSVITGAVIRGGATHSDDCEKLARVSWLMADAMLATRSK